MKHLEGDDMTTATRQQPARRGRRRSQSGHDAIINATIALLADPGYQKLTFDAVAAQTTVAKSTIYRWWPTKAALAAEALQQHLGTPDHHLTGDSHDDIQSVIRANAALYNDPVVTETITALAAESVRSPATAQRLNDVLGPRRAADAAVLLAAAGRGDLPHDLDTGLVLDTIAGTLLLRHSRGQPTTEHTIDQLTTLILDGHPPRRTRAEGPS